MSSVFVPATPKKLRAHKAKKSSYDQYATLLAPKELELKSPPPRKVVIMKGTTLLPPSESSSSTFQKRKPSIPVQFVCNINSLDDMQKYASEVDGVTFKQLAKIGNRFSQDPAFKSPLFHSDTSGRYYVKLGLTKELRPFQEDYNKLIGRQASINAVAKEYSFVPQGERERIKGWSLFASSLNDYHPSTPGGEEEEEEKLYPSSQRHLEDDDQVYIG